LKVDDSVKQLAGFTELSDYEKMLEEEVKDKMNSEDQLFQINDPSDGMEINLMIKGKQNYAPKQDTSK
jgi:hypothetical protein